LLSISSNYNNRDIEQDLCFLVGIENRCSFTECYYQWKLSEYSLFVCKSLLEHKADLHESGNYTLRCASLRGNTDTVTLLLRHKANVHTHKDYALQLASEMAHTDSVAVLLEHKVGVRACNDYAIRRASTSGHKETVALLLEYKADIHVI
jgi:ankyrin repeat protein